MLVPGNEGFSIKHTQGLPPAASRATLLSRHAMTTISRRDFLKRTGAAIASATMPAIAGPISASARETEAPPKPTGAELRTITDVAQKFMDKHNMPGLSVAIARHGQFVYQAGFGYADKAADQLVNPAHLFRIASVTKPITSVALFTLIQEGRLKLDDRVFGAGGVLGFDYGDGYPERVSRITIHHLLTHTSGGWANDGNDPMFRNLKMSHKELITWAVNNQSLKDEPGQHYAYSNFGYCILGRVLEKISGRSYSDFVRQAVLKPCGIQDMQLAGNTLAQRALREVLYYGGNGNPYNMNVTRMDSHGGWIGTPSDLVQFALHVDGFDTTPSILRKETIRTMTASTAANEGYACGWCVNRAHNYWHNGSLPGVTTILVRTASGLCWAAFANARSEGANLAIDQMMWKMVKAVPAWRA